MSELVELSKTGDIAVVTINNPPVNALSPGVPEGILRSVEAANADSTVRAIVVIGAGNTFVAGADITEFAKIVAGKAPPVSLAQAFLKLEDSAKPLIMALHGTAFGGGLELAMAGHYRVIAASGQVGQPEVKLGVIPGAAGTQRLPRLAGIPKALEMCSLGEPIGAREALENGIVDRIIEGDLLAGALQFASGVAGKAINKVRDRTDKLAEVDGNTARDVAKKVRRGQNAPLAAIDAVLASAHLPFTEGLAFERKLFEECLFSTQSKALIYAFFGERTVAKIPDIGKDVRPLDVRRGAIIGAGTMGGGIAMTFANAGIPVIVKDATQEALDRGMGVIRANYAGTVKKGRLTQQAMDERMAFITPQLTWDGFEQADVVVEAAFENMALKKQIFGDLDKIAKAGCILATNTSTLDVDAIAGMTSRPEMVVGMHFFSPANVMRLLEVIRGNATRPDVVATAMALGKKLKKVAVLARNCRGFIGNRMVFPYVREAMFMVEEGATVEAVNDALYDFGMAMGPLAMMDLSGIDVFAKIRQEFRHEEKAGVRQPKIGEQLYALGRYGQKTGRGFSLYDENRRARPDPEVAAVARGSRSFSPEEIVERCMLAMINEGALLLEEGIAIRPVDIDVVYLNGYGFPAHRGGPMFYADTLGLAHVVARIEALGAEHGQDLWTPAPLLARLAAEGKNFI
jgi:3-hydroxyacyl-CoA dehydrogenase